LQLKDKDETIRQQQAEIEALKKDNKELHAVAQRMAMAESDARKSLQWFKDAKERQSEPVAWMRTNKQWRKEVSWIEKEGFDTPLYTHPAEHDLGIAEAIGFEKGYKAASTKTLTDEEITQIVSEKLETWNTKEAMIDFVREILRKAQEK
jgi:regulator of replication initiation timing